jgi:hypothetical protein
MLSMYVSTFSFVFYQVWASKLFGKQEFHLKTDTPVRTHVIRFFDIVETLNLGINGQPDFAEPELVCRNHRPRAPLVPLHSLS